MNAEAAVFHSGRVVFERVHEDARIPERATALSAGMDVYAYLRHRKVKVWDHSTQGLLERPALPRQVEPGRYEFSVILYPGDRAILPLGFKATLPKNFQAEIRARSSWAFKRGLIVPNAPGTIDADYPDEWGVILANIGSEPQLVFHGDRVAQVVLMRYEQLPWFEGEVGVTTDRTGGIGSTG